MNGWQCWFQLSFPLQHEHLTSGGRCHREGYPRARTHPEEFRRRAVALARERTKPVAKLAKELRISESFLRNWMAQADVDESGSDTKLTSKEKKELTELRRQMRRLEMENEILKRAAPYGMWV